MSPIKEAAQKAISSLPDSVTLDELLEEIVFYAKFDEGLGDLDQGKVVAADEVKARFSA